MGGRSLSPIIHEAEELDLAEGRGYYFGMNYAGEFGSICRQVHLETRSGDEDDWHGSEPEVVCRSLDHVDMLGLNKATLRLRYLINRLISSLLQLRHPSPEDNLSLVQLYDPQMKYDRGASVFFNINDCHGNMLHPELVQTLANKNDFVSKELGGQPTHARAVTS
ncbi:hypothetical protein L7F22_040554 [Adiantum nelumboides]|nr:hypothetical protein [Adiantum nelumboides]